MRHFLMLLVGALFLMNGTNANEHDASVITKKKLEDIVFVVYCEDNSSLYAAKLVLSTIYNRAGSHDINKMQKEVSRKRQYHCFKMKRDAKKLNNERYRSIYEMVQTFIEEKQSPATKAKYFYNHKLVSQSKLGKMRLRVVKVHGSHTYLV